MQRLALRHQRPQNRLRPVGGDRRAREHQLDIVLAPELLGAPPLGQRRYGLEAPFFVGDPAERMVSVVDQLALPARLLFLILGPLLGGEADDLVGDILVRVRRRDMDSVGVQQRAPRGERQEVYTHRWLYFRLRLGDVGVEVQAGGRVWGEG